MSAGERAVIFASRDHLKPVSLLDSSCAQAGAGGKGGGGGEGGSREAEGGASVVPSPPSGIEDVEYEVQLDKIIQVRQLLEYRSLLE